MRIIEDSRAITKALQCTRVTVLTGADSLNYAKRCDILKQTTKFVL